LRPCAGPRPTETHVARLTQMNWPAVLVDSQMPRERRSSLYPDLPTMDEAGVKGFILTDSSKRRSVSGEAPRTKKCARGLRNRPTALTETGRRPVTGRPHPHAAGRVADRKALKRAFCSSLSPL